MVKPSLPKGMRDYLPEEMQKRRFLIETIRETFEKFNYKPVQTPAMENLATLTEKYGEEGDQLLFRVLRSGDFVQKANQQDWNAQNSRKLAAQIADKGLRYDLTVPLARLVAMHRHELQFPFKRYQVQPVWRADRPQKGRYREFFQCDADVIGSDSLVNEAEFVQIIDEVFSALNVRVSVHLNNRKILVGLAEYIGFPDRIIDITTAIDKMDKIGLENVCCELTDKGLTGEAVDKLKPVLQLEGSNAEKIAELRTILSDSETGLQGLAEMEEIFSIVDQTPPQCELSFDLCLARGLNYYTGTIIEVKAKDVAIGSICGGGRYDDLTGIFGLESVSGIGISFGAERIYDVMLALDLFPEGVDTITQLMAVNFGTKERDYCLPLLSRLRKKGISCEMYPEAAKVKKQMQYANKNNIPFVLMAGEEEINQRLYSLKNMRTGEQQQLTEDMIAHALIK